VIEVLASVLSAFACFLFPHRLKTPKIILNITSYTIRAIAFGESGANVSSYPFFCAFSSHMKALMRSITPQHPASLVDKLFQSDFHGYYAVASRAGRRRDIPDFLTALRTSNHDLHRAL
jgi:hypothetical protein